MLFLFELFLRVAPFEFQQAVFPWLDKPESPWRPFEDAYFFGTMAPQIFARLFYLRPFLPLIVGIGLWNMSLWIWRVAIGWTVFEFLDALLILASPITRGYFIQAAINGGETVDFAQRWCFACFGSHVLIELILSVIVIAVLLKQRVAFEKSEAARATA